MTGEKDQQSTTSTFVEMASEMTEILEAMRGHTLPPALLHSADALCSKVHAHAVRQGDDAAELSSARQELRNSNARFEVLTDAMPQMVWTTRPDGYHDYYNARWYEFTGVTPGSTDGEGWADLFHPDDQQKNRGRCGSTAWRPATPTRSNIACAIARVSINGRWDEHCPFGMTMA